MAGQTKLKGRRLLCRIGTGSRSARRAGRAYAPYFFTSAGLLQLAHSGVHREVPAWNLELGKHKLVPVSTTRFPEEVRGGLNFGWHTMDR